MSMMNARILETEIDVDEAQPGLYVVESGTPAYFPAVALTRAGLARFVGELYEEDARSVMLEVLPTAGPGRPLGLGDEVEIEHRVMPIDPNFFTTALRDYKEWKVKWWRECIQNSIDAGARNIALTSTPREDGTVVVSCEDDGGGMDKDTLLFKFLTVGASGKSAATSTVGGFGKAKELILLPWLNWSVHSRDVLAEGTGLNHRVVRADHRHGTRVEVVMPADNHTSDVEAIAFVERCHLPHVAFTVNGEPVLADLVATSMVISAPGKADIYFTPATEKQSYLYVRAHGLYMFNRYIGEIPGYILAELTAPSTEILTANRDGFRDWTVESTIDRLAQKIAKDNLSALREKQGLIRKKYTGTGKFRAEQLATTLINEIGPAVTKLSNSDKEQVVAILTDHARQDEEALRATQLPSPQSARVMLEQKFTGPNHIEAAMKQLVWEPDFFLVNDIEGWHVPKKFFPETMAPRVMKLAKTWVELCRYVLIQLGSETEFGVGFIFSRETAAAALAEDDFGSGRVSHWLMVNPFKRMVEGPIWHPTTDADLKWLYAAAIHEATHFADGISYHDESFAAALTRNMARCADGYRKIKKIVAGVKMHGGMEAD